MKEPNERLDKLTKNMARAGGLGDEDVDRISSAPFLHARIRVRIEAERKRRAAQGSGWLATLLVASRAVAVLLLVTISAALAFWVSRAHTPARDSLAGAGDDNISRIVTGGACALSATDECAISTEEVLATLFAEEGGRLQK